MITPTPELFCPSMRFLSVLYQPIARHSISMREAYDNAMAYNRLMRAEEEEVLLVQEMCAYISHFKQNVLSTLMSKVQSKDFAMFTRP